MRLWSVFELLIFFVLLAFVSTKSVGRQDGVTTPIAPVVEAVSVAVEAVATEAAALAEVVTEAAPEAPGSLPSRFCKCENLECNCCREFRLPVLPISSSGCASLKYLKGDKMSLTMRIGDSVLRNITISGKKNKPACVSLPGGFSQFCGRVYGISRQGDDFKACLGLELRALADLEASLRVSCFRFSKTGVTMEAAPPLPAVSAEEEDEDDDDGGLFGFGGDDDDEDDEDGDIELPFGDDDDEADNDVTDADADTDVDYAGFSVLGGFGDIFGGFFDDTTETGNKKKKKPEAVKKPVETEVNEIPAATTQKPNKKDVTTPRVSTSASTIQANIISTTDKPTKLQTFTVKPVKIETIPAKPVRIETATFRPVNKIVPTTEKQPTTTIVLSPTSSVKITTTVETTTTKAVVPDPLTVSSEEKLESEEKSDNDDEDDEDEIDLDEEFGDDDDDEDDAAENTTDDAIESFSNELVDAIKGVEEELSGVADIVDEPQIETEEEVSGEATKPSVAGKPSASIAVKPVDKPSDEEEFDILDEVEKLAEEVSSTIDRVSGTEGENDTEEDEEEEAQGGVPMDGEPRNVTKTTTEAQKIETSSVAPTVKVPTPVVKRTNRISRVSRHQA